MRGAVGDRRRRDRRLYRHPPPRFRLLVLTGVTLKCPVTLDVQSLVPDYTWVLRAFLKAHGSEPTFVITDQCPSMKHTN
ncbi:hypothetical protein OSB04_016228 [Centaurea solstitialis]|uniref:Transposase n=1 Tax=Centaurea solstitialis TaxID=347529 RepID=A0AA38T897_9ASTR|nr:hypothetical protein OSB04_016228 [Centaurea solstitialis]